jgi:UDP-N-acetylglucosamine 1-carboxyvinyltransferase
MEKLIIGGGYPLKGEITPSGNKNAALPLLAACLLTDEPVILHNLPDIMDVATMGLLLESLGVEIENLGRHSWRICAKEVRPADLDPDSWPHGCQEGRTAFATPWGRCDRQAAG